MADNQELSARVRMALAESGDIREVKMFGGIGFMLNGNLVAAASTRGLLLRVGKDQQDKALANSGARRMIMRGRAMEGYVYIDPPGLTSKSVKDGMRVAVAFVKTLPPKTKPKSEPRKGKRK